MVCVDVWSSLWSEVDGRFQERVKLLGHHAQLGSYKGQSYPTRVLDFFKCQVKLNAKCDTSGTLPELEC